MTETGNILFIKGRSQYSAMRNYIDEIETGFRMAGYNTCVLDVTDESFRFQQEQLQNSVKTDIIFVCNAIQPTRISDVYITYLTDHPAAHRERLAVLDERAVVFVCDRRHEAYVRKYCPNIKHVEYIPLSGEVSKQYIPYGQRSKDIVFTGSYKRPERAYKDIFFCDESVSEIAKYLAESIIENPQQDLEELPEKVKWLLEHPVEAEKIAAAGKERAEKELTWQHRTFEMIRYVQECFFLLVPESGKYGDIIQIKYRTLHERSMVVDAIRYIHKLMGMIAQVKQYDKMEVCDIEYFYTNLLSWYVKISANFPEITISNFIYDYLMNVTEEQVESATELLLLECMHMLAIFLEMENQELRNNE